MSSNETCNATSPAGRELVVRSAPSTDPALRARVQELEAYIDARHDEWQKLNAKIAEYKDALRGMRETLKTSDAKVIEAELSDRILELERRCSELAGRLHERESRCEELRRQIEAKSADAENARAELGEARNEIQRLEAVLEGRSSEFDEHNRRRDDDRKRIEKLTEERDDLRVRLGDAAHRIEQAEQRRDEGWSEAERLRSEIAAQQELVAELEDEVKVRQQKRDALLHGTAQNGFERSQPMRELLPAEMLDDEPGADRIVDVGEPTGGYARVLERRRIAVALEASDGTTYTIDKDNATIGRSRNNDICIPKDFVSRTHARLAVRPIGTTIEDAGSTNGIWVNSKRVTQGVLRDGDVISFGNGLRFRFVELGA